MKKTTLYIAGFLFLTTTICQPVMAQPVSEAFAQLLEEEDEDLYTIAIYPKNVRDNIFIIAGHPEAITKLSDAQKKSNTTFRTNIAGYSKEEQEKIWNLMRYNNLVSDLANAKGKRKKTETILKKYPADIHDDAMHYAINHPDLMLQLDQANKEFNTGFQQIISVYPPRVQTAFREMIALPEAIALLNKNLHLTVHLGDFYNRDSVYIIQQFDSLHLVVAEEKAREKEEWKQNLQNNPEAEKEIKQSAEAYAKEKGYGENTLTSTEPNVIERYVYVPYPYWCGYPWWYEYDYWYPNPIWYHWGFYIWNGNMVWIGTPSWYFIHWHFNHHHHFYHYPHITNLYINYYYYGPRKYASGNTREVRSWMKRNESSFPRDFKENTPDRIERIREYGKSEIDRQDQIKKNAGQPISRDEFIRQHADEYPHLKETKILDQAPPGKTDIAKPDEKDKQKNEPVKPTPVPVRKEQTIPVEKGKVTPHHQPAPVTPKTKEVKPRVQPTLPKQAVPQKPVVQPKKEKQTPGRK